MATIAKLVITAMNTPVGQSAIEAATKRNGRIFAAYIVVLLVTALVIAFFTWLTWDSGNKVQDAIQDDASARIEEANAVAAQANERAAEANQKAEEERLARIKIEERIGGWRLDTDAQARITDKLKSFPDTPFDLKVHPDEARFMDALDRALVAAKWIRQDHRSISPGSHDQAIMLDPKAALCASCGIHVELAESRMADLRPAAEELIKALGDEGITVTARTLPDEQMHPNAIHITIGKRE